MTCSLGANAEAYGGMAMLEQMPNVHLRGCRQLSASQPAWCRYGLTDEQLQQVEQELEELAASARPTQPLPLVSLMGELPRHVPPRCCCCCVLAEPSAGSIAFPTDPFCVKLLSDRPAAHWSNPCHRCGLQTAHDL